MPPWPQNHRKTTVKTTGTICSTCPPARLACRSELRQADQARRQRIARAAGLPVQRQGYGNFDVAVDNSSHFSAPPHLNTTPHTCRVLHARLRAHADRGLSGAWTPMVCPIWGFRSAERQHWHGLLYRRVRPIRERVRLLVRSSRFEEGKKPRFPPQLTRLLRAMASFFLFLFLHG